jgi:hypothetical protein
VATHEICLIVYYTRQQLEFLTKITEFIALTEVTDKILRLDKGDAVAAIYLD